MDILVIIVGLTGSFIFSVIATGLLEKYALRRLLIDVPNERSSHTRPTPRGGGLSIAFVILMAIGLLFFGGWLPMEFALALGVGGLIVVVVGWIDDHRHIPALWRAMAYGVAAILAVYCLGGFSYHWLGLSFLPLGVIGSVLVVIWIIWMTNLYNFMDGTDALAALQAICVGLLAGVLFWLEGQFGVAMICFVIVTSNFGFLFWNWPPAKIFMGDAGSCTLGFYFGVLTLIGEIQGSVPLTVWFILLSIFICDATLTLLMRVIKGEVWYQAHKSHAYQRLAQLGVSHKKLALSVLLINVMILWPMATMAFVWDEYSYYMAAASILLISVLWGAIQVHYHRHYS